MYALFIVVLPLLSFHYSATCLVTLKWKYFSIIPFYSASLLLIVFYRTLFSRHSFILSVLTNHPSYAETAINPNLSFIESVLLTNCLLYTDDVVLVSLPAMKPKLLKHCKEFRNCKASLFMHTLPLCNWS